MIQRIFHSIGQGAFYSERHDDFNIVYDCGNWKNTKLADKVVKNSFNSNDEIDILFISHFDYDHVNKISTLKSKFKIRRVVLPLLYDDERKFLVNFYNNLGLSNIVSLIENPLEYFGDDTVVITVDVSKNDKDGFNEDTIKIENSTSGKINSGTLLKLEDWAFIPFNFEYKSRKLELEQIFKKRGLDIEKFRKDSSYLINNRKAIKDAYDAVSGKINQNSMVLYSGPISNNNRILYCHSRLNCNWCDCPHIHCFRFYPCTDRVGCVYTGDADLNITNINLIFNKYWGYVGTIQIPHHGDLTSFSIDILNDEEYCCPISVGVTNSYGHPSSQLIADIYKKSSIPVLITENLDSNFIQIIE